jgi:hypothetical protein
MPIINKYPSKAQLRKFKNLCAEVYQSYRVPDHQHGEYTMTHKDALDKVKIFVLRLRVTNISSLLSYVVNTNQTELVSLLERMTDQVDETDSDGNTVLHIAVEHEDRPSVCALLERGVDHDAINLDGESALHIAAEMGQMLVVRDLLKVGANIFGMDDRSSPHHSETVLNFLRNVMLDRTEDENTPILASIEHMLKEVDDLVRNRVAEMDRMYVEERELAFMMGTHARIGKLSPLYHIEPGVLKEFILKEAYPGGVRMVEPHKMTRFIQDAFNIYEDRERNAEPNHE